MWNNFKYYEKVRDNYNTETLYNIKTLYNIETLYNGISNIGYV
jgi:hypothetical protein